MLRHILTSIRLTLVLALVCGLAYPLVMTGIAQGLFHDKADGSLVTDRNGNVVGSSLIGQCFYQTAKDKNGDTVYNTTKDDQGNTIFAIDPRYFQGRYSASGCDAANSAGSNLGPSNAALISRIKGYSDYLRSLGIAKDQPMPVDLVTGDFTGFDPDISEAAALAQVDMVATARGLAANRVRQLVEQHVDGRDLGVFGEPHVNVLSLNMAIDDGEAG